MTSASREDVIRQLFTEARTHKAWLDEAVSPQTLRQLFEAVRWAPSSNNSAPARFVFAVSEAARQTAMTGLHEGNRAKVMGAPVITVISCDVEHWRHWQRLSPHKNLAAIFEADRERSWEEAYRNALIQCGYFIIAARALGLDAFPLTGFHREIVDQTELVPPGARSILICALGRGDPARLRKRADRLEFEDACRIL